MNGMSHNDPTAQSIGVDKIKGAVWNTHRTKKDDESIKTLADNIGLHGMIHRIAVRMMTDGEYEIVDGHRRFAAAKKLGWTTVPCEVYEDLADEEAQERTLSANIQRISNDPLLEAECIEKLSNAGKTYEQIAAVLGMDAKHVARRARLINLTPGWRKWLEDVSADASTMETIARHEQTLQEQVFEGLDIADGDGDVSDEQIERAFSRHMRKIDDETPFDCEQCKACRYNTANHGYLFADDEDASGHCQRAACFEEKWNAAVDAEIKKLRDKKISIKEVAQKWNVPDHWNATRKKTKKNNAPFVYREGNLKNLVWSRNPEHVAAGPAMTEEEKEAARKIKKAHAAWTKNRRAAYDKIRRLLKDQEAIERVVNTMVASDRFWEHMKKKLNESYRAYVYDANCQEIYEILTSAGLADANCEALTSDELVALDSCDPADAVSEETANREGA